VSADFVVVSRKKWKVSKAVAGTKVRTNVVGGVCRRPGQPGKQVQEKRVARWTDTRYQIPRQSFRSH
jgi:hypothetical protein